MSYCVMGDLFVASELFTISRNVQFCFDSPVGLTYSIPSVTDVTFWPAYQRHHSLLAATSYKSILWAWQATNKSKSSQRQRTVGLEVDVDVSMIYFTAY